MLVPGIHSDSKIKLQEEVCTRKQQSLSDWQTFGIPSCVEFRVCSCSFSLWSVLFRFRRDSGELPGLFFFPLFLFVGTVEKQSNSSEHTLLLAPPALDTER